MRYPEQMRSAHIGPHEVYVDEELITVRYHGVVTLDQAVALFALLDEIRKQHGGFLLLADLRDAGVMGPEARRYVSEHVKEEDHPVFMFGIRPTSRMLITLMMRAIRLLGRRPPNIRFLASESEARQEIQVVRAKLRAKKIQPPGLP